MDSNARRENGATVLMIARAGIALILLFLVVRSAAPFTWPWQMRGPWPRSSTHPVTPLGHPTVDDRAEELRLDPDAGFSFVVFGDQRALADGEWQLLLGQIAYLDRTATPFLFMLDTGDIVEDGRHSDQFQMLREILHPVRRLPYLVCVGNHELKNNRGDAGRTHTAAFLKPLSPGFSTECMYYQKRIGATRILFLNTNDFVYGDDGAVKQPDSPLPESRAAAQMAWLVAQLADTTARQTIAVLHHPFIQTSTKHRKPARRLWSYRYQDRTLPDILLDGGVDIVLTGHTHTYERFLLRRADGKQMHLINISGRPRTELLWIGDDRRRARDIRGREAEWFADHGWADLAGWQVIQREAMITDEVNQFGIFLVDATGRITLEMAYLDENAPGGLRRTPPVHLE